MTKEDIVLMFKMRVDGMTLEEIGKEFGVTRQRVQQLLEANTKDPALRKVHGCECIYPALLDWMVTNCVSAYKLRKECGFGKTIDSFYARLRGVRPFDIDEIRKILDYTGMTFEEAFRTVETNVCEQ